MAERLQQEGWFDDEPCPIPDWFEANNNRFTDGTRAEVRLHDARPLQAAWENAFRLWADLGDASHLLLTPEEKNVKKQLADAFRRDFKTDESGLPPRIRKEDLPANERDRLWEEYQAFVFMHELEIVLRVTNFMHHYLRAGVEQRPETTKARKLFYLADTKRLSASPHEALLLYNNPDAIPAWRKILMDQANKEFLQDMLIQEDTAEIQLKYFDLVNDDLKPKAQRATRLPWAFPLPIRITPERFPGSLVPSPFLDEKGNSLVTDQSLRTVEQRRIRPGAKQPAETGRAGNPLRQRTG